MLAFVTNVVVAAVVAVVVVVVVLVVVVLAVAKLVGVVLVVVVAAETAEALVGQFAAGFLVKSYFGQLMALAVAAVVVAAVVVLLNVVAGLAAVFLEANFLSFSCTTKCALSLQDQCTLGSLQWPHTHAETP